MKKLLSIALVLMLLLNVGALAASPDITPDMDAQQGDVDDWLFADDGVDEWDEEYDPGIFEEYADDEIIAEEDMVEDTLLGAMEVYSWFVMQPLDVDPEKPDSTGTRFQVLDERFNTMEALRDFVSQYFSDELVDELFAMNVYTSENGYLYTTTDGRNIDETIIETEFQVTSENIDEVVYTVIVHYWGEEEGVEEEFEYVRQNFDGVWKFVVFPFFW